MRAFLRGHYLFIHLILNFGEKQILIAIIYKSLGKSLHDPLWEIFTFNELGQLHSSDCWLEEGASLRRPRMVES